MILSRAEIAAALAAYRLAGQPTLPGYAGSAAQREVRTQALLAECAPLVMDRPTYRTSLVTRLHRRVIEGTYRASADAIVDQLLGRLVAAKLAG